MMGIRIYPDGRIPGLVFVSSEDDDFSRRHRHPDDDFYDDEYYDNDYNDPDYWCESDSYLWTNGRPHPLALEAFTRLAKRGIPVDEELSGKEIVPPVAPQANMGNFESSRRIGWIESWYRMSDKARQPFSSWKFNRKDPWRRLGR